MPGQIETTREVRVVEEQRVTLVEEHGTDSRPAKHQACRRRLLQESGNVDRIVCAAIPPVGPTQQRAKRWAAICEESSQRGQPSAVVLGSSIDVDQRRGNPPGGRIPLQSGNELLKSFT